ncbi:MAG: tetratricopeptide repeat protein [Gammaproteobacteria bacterium]
MARPNWCRMLLLRPTSAGFSLVRAMASVRVIASVGVVAAVLSACGTAPTAADRASAAPDEATSSASGRATSAAGGGASGTASPSAQPEIPKRALSDFERAVGLMRSGNTTDAELEFKQLAVGYPQLTGAQINLALLQRKANRLDEAEATLKAATESNPGSAKAWTELGLTQRMRGQFPDAAASYEKAIAADANYAPAHRNYAVLLDLYLGNPEHALTELERYKELTGEEKPVTGWIAELRQRTGKPAAPKPAAAPAQPAPDAQPSEEPSKPAVAVPQPRAGRGA